MKTIKSPKAFNISFTNSKVYVGRDHRATYRSAVVIADSVAEAAKKAEEFCKKHFQGMRVEEIRLDDNLVIQ